MQRLGAASAAASCPAASASAACWRGRWRCMRRCCCWTSRPRTWTRRTRWRWCGCCSAWRAHHDRGQRAARPAAGAAGRPGAGADAPGRVRRHRARTTMRPCTPRCARSSSRPSASAWSMGATWHCPGATEIAPGIERCVQMCRQRERRERATIRPREAMPACPARDARLQSFAARQRPKEESHGQSVRTPECAAPRHAGRDAPRHRKGKPAHPGHRRAGDDAAPRRAGLGADAPAHHHRFQRIAARADHRRAQGHRRLPGRTDPGAPVRLSPHRRRDAVGGQHALRVADRREHPDRALRLVQRRPRQERLSHGPGPPLRPAHADDFGHPLQLVAAGAVERRIVRADPQLPSPGLPAAVPVRRVACRCVRASSQAANTGCRR